jgi:hypothetical protein
MIVRAGSSWQTVLADLAIILFMVTAAPLSQSDEQTAAPQPSPRGTPLALYRAEPGAPKLGDWLAAQGADKRQQLTIVAQYGVGGLALALEQAKRLAGDGGEAGMRSRIVVEPGAGGVTVALGYDDPGQVLARDLRSEAGNLETRP